MKPLVEHFMESLQVNEGSTSKYQKILGDSKTHKKNSTVAVHSKHSTITAHATTEQPKYTTSTADIH